MKGYVARTIEFYDKKSKTLLLKKFIEFTENTLQLSAVQILNNRNIRQIIFIGITKTVSGRKRLVVIISAHMLS